MQPPQQLLGALQHLTFLHFGALQHFTFLHFGALQHLLQPLLQPLSQQDFGAQQLGAAAGAQQLGAAGAAQLGAAAGAQQLGAAAGAAQLGAAHDALQVLQLLQWLWQQDFTFLHFGAFWQHPVLQEVGAHVLQAGAGAQQLAGAQHVASQLRARRKQASASVPANAKLINAAAVNVIHFMSVFS